MAAIEQRHREQVEQADRDREQRDQPDQRAESADLGDLAGDAGDADRPGQLVGGFAPGRQLAEIGEGALDHEDGLVHAEAEGGDGTVGDELRLGGGGRADAEPPDAVAAELGALLVDLRRRDDRHVGTRPFDDEVQRRSGAAGDDAVHRVEIGDRLAVDALDQVAGLEAGLRRRAVRIDRRDPGGQLEAASEPDRAGKQQDREDEVRHRPGDDDRRALGDRLGREADRPLVRGHLRDGVRIGDAGAVGVAVELDVAAERDRAELPAGAVTVVEADEFRPEADGEGVDADAAPAADEEVPHLVDEDHDGQNEQERDHRTEEAGGRAAHRGQEIHASILGPRSGLALRSSRSELW